MMPWLAFLPRVPGGWLHQATHALGAQGALETQLSLPGGSGENTNTAFVIQAAMGLEWWLGVGV